MNTTVVRMKFGSHLYGTNTPQSDTDFKAVHLPTADEILLQRVQGSINSGPKKQGDGVKNALGDVDTESYSLQRYLSLLAEGQTVAIDMLFAPTAALLECSPMWNTICLNRHRLLTKKSAAFVGYCRQQANKYGIKGSRVAAAKNAMEFFAARPIIAKVGDFQDELLEQLCVDEHTAIVQGEPRPMDSAGVIRCETFFECCNRKVAFTNTVKQAHEVFTKIYENYGARAKLAESNEGVDWKALSHAVRVGMEALELLETGNITFPLPYAKRIRSIKLGEVVYAEVAEEIEQLLLKVESAAEQSPLRDTADFEFIDDLVRSVYGSIVVNDWERQLRKVEDQ